MYLTTCILSIVATTGGQNDQIQELRQMVEELKDEVAQLKNQESDWLSEHRTNEIRNLVRDVLADANARTNLLGEGTPASYSNGFFITSADSNWKLKINGQLQARWLYNEASNQNAFNTVGVGPLENIQHGFEQRRTKINFSGHVLDSSWTYKFSTTWGRAGGSNTEDAWISKKFDDGGWFKFGQFKANFLRENIVSSSKQLAVDRSMLNNAFTYGWTQGIELGWSDDDVKLLVQYTDGPNQNNTAALQDPVEAWVARAEFRFGDAGWKDFGYLTSTKGADSGLLVGVSYQTFDIDTLVNTNNIEYGNTDAFESRGWTVDATLRGDGWNIFGYVVDSTGKGFNGVGEQDSGGWLVQGGIMMNDNTELFMQYQDGEINNATFLDGSNNMNALRVGFNYWPIAGSNNIKWTTDIAWAGDAIADDADAGSGIAAADWASTGNGWRRDAGRNDGQMLIRTQLQLLF